MEGKRTSRIRSHIAIPRQGSSMELSQRNVGDGISLKEILPDCQIFGADSVRVSACCHDWNQIRPGDLYVAKVGFDKDGHDHIRVATRKGASAILCERFVVSDIPVCLVEDTREAYGKICQRLVGTPKDHMKMIGVSGTDGKSIVTQIIRSVFQKAGLRTGFVSSLGFCDGIVTHESTLTTPQPPQLAENLGELVANGCDVAIVESSSAGIAERRLAGIEFDACVFTNVKKDHVDSYGTLESYRRIKTNLLKRLKPSGFAVVNSDDKYLGKWLRTVDCPALTYGMRNYSEVSAERIEQTANGQTFLLVAGNETIPVHTPIIGDFYIRHCLAATTLGLTFGLPLEDIVAGIEDVISIPGRMELVAQGQDFPVFVDAAKTPSQLGAMLKTLRSISPTGKVRCVFGGAERVSKIQRAGLGTIAEKYADQTIISGIDIHNESALAVAHDILDGYDDVAKAHVIPNRAAAIKFALESANAGDAVLIAGLGEKPTSFGYNAELSLTDREICETWIRDRNSLDDLAVHFDETLPVSYMIDDYR